MEKTGSARGCTIHQTSVPLSDWLLDVLKTQTVQQDSPVVDTCVECRRVRRKSVNSEYQHEYYKSCNSRLYKELEWIELESICTTRFF